LQIFAADSRRSEQPGPVRLFVNECHGRAAFLSKVGRESAASADCWDKSGQRRRGMFLAFCKLMQ
jgi:hypothetical protein